MKKLVFASLLLGSLSQAAGCIITTDDDDGNGGPIRDGAAQIDVAWTLEGGCQGATTIQVVSDDGSGAEPFEDLYDCVDSGTAVTAPLPLGTYDVWINVIDDDGFRYASSLAEVGVVLANEGDIAQVPEFVFPTDAGFMTLTWNILDDATDAEIECADVGAVDVGFLASVIPADPGIDPYDFTWACEEFAGITGPMLLGDYTIAIDVLDAGGESLNNESVVREESLTYGNERVDLGNFDFAFTL